MLYTILKPIIIIAVKVFFRRIHIKGIENLPQNQAILIASNHTNAFFDALVLSVFLKQKLHTLARGDVFKNRFAKQFLKRIKVNPIYRLQEGAENLHKNQATFEICNKLFKEKQSVMIFPEGICIQHRRLCKLKKGTARIVFGAEEAFDYKLNLKVVPIGINYSTPSRFGGTLIINIDKPIEVSKYIEEYKINKAKTVNQFTSHLEKKMQRLIVSVEHTQEQFVDQVEKIYKPDLIGIIEGEKDFLLKDFVASRHIAKAAQHLEISEEKRFQELKNKINIFFEEIKKHGINHKFIHPEYIRKAKNKHIIFKSILLILTSPVFLIGLLLNYIPFKVPYIISKRIVKNIEFFTSINIGLGMIMFLFYYSLVFSISYLLFRDIRIPLVILILAPLTGLFSLNWWRLLREIQGLKKIKKNAETTAFLFSERNEIIKELRGAKNNYLRKN